MTVAMSERKHLPIVRDGEERCPRHWWQRVDWADDRADWNCRVCTDEMERD